MSGLRQLPGDFIPAPDDVLVDGMGQQWVPAGWPCLLREGEEERLADALAKAPIANWLGDEERLRISLLRQARVVIAVLREER